MSSSDDKFNKTKVKIQIDIEKPKAKRKPWFRILLALLITLAFVILILLLKYVFGIPLSEILQTIQTIEEFLIRVPIKPLNFLS